MALQVGTLIIVRSRATYCAVRDHSSDMGCVATMNDPVRAYLQRLIVAENLKVMLVITS